MPQPSSVTSWRLLPVLFFAILPACASQPQDPVKAFWLPASQEAWSNVPPGGYSLVRRDGSRRTVSESVLRNVVVAKRDLEQISGVHADLGLADMDAPNAFAFYRQGRPVVAISLSWLDQLGQDVDALATTIGHELAHLYLGHTGTARQERENTAQGASQIVGTALSLAGVPMAGAIANVGAIAVARSFSRDEERAADDYGIRWAVAAGYDPCGRARTMRMYQRLRAGTVEIPFLSTHPGAAERSELADAYSLKTTNRPCLE
ncbi:MAG TPA: M48 family metalloprotease [Burkholderiales bacterium]|jgi:Zn-dependent protease with chaperone function|nr:M48 family metalloprotease [Burkholderiales bacterium]